MTEKIFKYKAEGRDYDIPESRVNDFLDMYPNATVRANVDGRDYDIPHAKMPDFLKAYPNASYTLDSPLSTVVDTNYEPTLPESEEDAPEMSRRERRQARREARRNDDRPSWGESAAKGVGAGFTRTGKGLLDALHQLSAGMLYNDPETGEAKRLESYDTQMQDDTNTFRNASVLASETAEELSREADPTGGEKGFVDLIAEGKIGMALQKGLSTGAESLPMTLSAYNPWTMALNAISMAGANYAEETLDNPEIDPWKRAVKAIGSAAIEQAVEKFADPVFKYIGGGKGAGELTEELAKELVEKGTKEATENIAKRIFRVLKNTAKDAAGEGVEEVVTSFGNDALGQALDWIDGDNDYGIRAQWEQMKSENPDADAWDFALAKGKEYMDSFIGGALSGGYMSGTANVFSEGAKFKYDRDARKILDESHAIGSSLDYGDMYDSDDTVREQIDAVAATFTNENGEASISGEFIGTLSSEDAFALSRRNDFTPEQRNALFGLARAKAIQEGLTTKLDERLESQVNAERILIEAATESGSIITAMYGGKPVYVMGAMNKGDGTVTAPSGQNGPVMVVDALTGEKSYARSEDIQFAESRTPTDYAAEVETMLRENDARNRQVAQSTMSVRAKAKAVKPFAGKKILVDVGNGLAEVLVQQISPNGDVIIKGKKGDLGGQSIMTLSADVFYDSIYRDEDGNPVITEAPQEAEAETPQEEAPVAETTGNEDYRGQTISILLNGVPTEVEVMSQDNPSDSIVYEYTDASGNRRTASSTIGAFNAAIQQAAEYVAPTPTAEETPSVETVPADSETQAPQEVPVTPENIDWDALFEQDPEAYFVELQNQFGEEALDILNEEVVAAQEELDSLSKKRGKTQNERLENRQKKVALQNRIAALNGMIARLAPAAAPIAETPVTPETAEMPVSETPATETPAEVAPTEQPTATPETAPAVAETTPVAETPAVPESTEPAPVEQAPVAEAPAETVAEPEPTTQPTAETTPEPEPEPAPSPAPTPSKPTAKGGAIGRMIGEAKKQIAKLAAKANIKDFTVDDNVRPVFGGVLRQGGYEYASDSHILAKIKTQYPAEQEGKIYSVKTGKEIEGRFPKADLVISGAESVNTPVNANVDDILAAAQAAEELKKGFDKSKKVYVRVGRNHFDSSYLLKAARMAKQQGLTTITQHPTENRAMLFSGENGVVLIMPMTLGENPDVIDASTGEAMFASAGVAHGIKMPTTLKGIEVARTTFEAVLPNLSQKEIDALKDSEYIKLVDGKVVVSFWKSDIDNAKKKAKDPNTFAALEAIEKNGLEIPLSANEIAKLFPESAAPVAPAATSESAPVAPNPVDNPAREAQKREKALAQQLQRYGISPEQKSDMAFNAGKAVGDFFATREEYDAYAENATDLGDYNADFERGVEASFANRQQNVGNSPVNSVPLETEPNGENNGEASTGESGTGQSDNGSVRQTSDGGGQEVHQGTSEAKPTQGKNKGGSKTKQVASKYPARKGNATQKLLKDTFGFESVTIPNNRKETLNAIYDFMMEMSKMLGISPKSIGQGGMLGVGRLNANARATAEHSLDRNKFTFDFIDASIKFKYAKLEGIAHEWWHALDYALGYFDSGKVYGTTTEMSDRQFSGRKETYDAVQEVMQAIKDSGYPARIKSLTTSFAALRYYLNPTEMAARAFDGYLRDIFAAAGISIEGASYDYIDTDPSQQTPEEMAVIAPAFDNLFKVLQEKEGKTPGTSVLYHIGEMMAEDSPAKRLATDAVLTALDDTGIDVVRATDKQTQQMLDIMDEVAEMQKGTAPETASVQEEHHPTVVSSADGAKVIKDLDSAIQEYEEKSGASKTLLGDIANALGAKKHGSNSQYATFEAKNGKIFTIRLANHNARVSNFDNHNEDEGISIVIASAPNGGIDNDGRAHIVEFYYDSIKLRKAEGKPLVEILKSIKQALYSGEYKDNTGIAQVQEVNGPELMTAYHGSPSLFDEFDHSHMGEGEGAQAHGWGTYVAKSADTAKDYARMGRVSYTGPRQSYGSYEYEVVEDIVSIMNHGNSFEEAIKIGRRYWSNLQWEPSHRAKRAFLETLTPDDFKLRNLYEVEIPEDSGENYFYESNPTRKQVEKLYDACQKEGLEYADVIAGETLLDNRPVGNKIVRNLSKMLGSPQAASEFLSRAGFVGIKYDGRRDGECFVIFNESDAKITGRTEFYRTPNGTVYGWTDGKKIYLTNAGINPNTPIHEYTHLWAKAMMQKNPKGWNSIKKLLKGTPVWNEVMSDPNYSSIHNDEDAVASEALSRISGKENAAKMEKMAQKMIDDAKGTARKLEARGLVQNMRDALNRFWEFVWKDLFKMGRFISVEHVTDRILFDLLNGTDIGELQSGRKEFSFIGEKGAESIDNADETTVRLDNLATAREMEESGKDAKAIKLATGWERGADGKWRYEISDKDFRLKETWREARTLGDAIEHDELFAAYPHLKDLRLSYKVIPKYANEPVYAVLRPEGIWINPYPSKSKDYDLRAVLVHEIQHAIQNEEGFAKGGNPNTQDPRQVKAREENIAYFTQKIADDKAAAEELQKQKDELNEKISSWRARHDGNASFDEEYREYTAKLAEVSGKLDELNQSINHDEMHLMLSEISSTTLGDAGYRRLAGEVEARNAAARIPMSLSERLSTIAEETEDVAREDQYVLENLSEGQVQAQIVTDPDVIAELEASPKRTGYRNVVQNEDGTFSSPMAYWLQGTKEGAKIRVETAKFEMGKWEEAEEHPELVDEKGHVVLVKPNKSTVEVAYDPYIHNRLDPVNLQFKDAWKRDELVYVETVVPETDLESGYHADQALLPVGVHSWSNGDVMLSKYDKPVRIMPWEAVADAWVERLNGNGVHFDVVPPALRSLLIERGVEILPPHKGMGKDCLDAYEAWKKESENSGFTSVDADYLAAVERGDMETAQRMVLEAAKSAMPKTKVVDEDGNPKVVYHGSNAQFTEFDTARIGSTTGTADGRGFYFTTDRDYAEGFTTPDGQLFDVYLNIENPLSYERKTITKAQLRKILKEADRVEFEREGEHYMLSNYANYNDVGIDGAINEAANLEYDYADNDVELVGSLIGGSGSFELIMDAVRKVTGKSGMIAPKDNGTTHYVVTNPSAIKSASAVTYDDAGNVIPLSERFNPLNPDIRYRGSENNSLSSQSYEGTGDTYTDNDGRGIPQEGTGVSGEVSVSGPLSEGRRLARPENGKVSQDGVAGFNPIHEREGESDRQRNNREAKFLSFVNNLTSAEQVNLYGFLKDYMSSPSGILRGRANDFINSIRQNGNNSFADFVEDFINDELRYREGVSSAEVAKHGLLVGVKQSLNALERMFYAFNKDQYNGVLFDRVLKLAKRFGVSVKFETRNADGSFIANYGSYNPNDNSITLDANLLAKGNESELCQTILHELIHSVVARAASIMTGRAVDKNNQFIDPQSLPKDVVDGINTLKEVYEAIKDDGTFQDTYGKKDFEEMLSEITDPKFRGLLKAKKLWKKFLNGICKLLGIADESSSESDALSEIESALDNILSAAERGELDSAYASYLGQLADGYTLADLQRLGSGPVKTLLTQNVLFRTGIDVDTMATETAKEVYGRAVKARWQEFQRQFQDAMQPVRIAIDAIQQETGNIPIEDYENYLLIKNQASSRSRVEIDNFQRRYFSPVVEQVNKIIDQIMESRGWNVKDKSKRAEVYSEVKQYLIAKHGLERNELFRSTKGEDRDYSGLTALFGLEAEEYVDAERMAQELVDNFENEVSTDELWAKINAATNKTLRHSYECGLLSRSQYEQIRDMFEFYIPLRGFDETTAEDVYSYLRFESNSFSPAVKEAKGRTSIADDPLAYIMTMAESEITQGNNNRAKQALFNFLLNRASATGKQNTLMQVEDVWYVKSVDGSGVVTQQIAAPNHAAGETYEEFEARMQALEATGDAFKSKKGQVDVGMRFQVKRNQNAHYIYLKVNGVEKAIYINGDPKAADAVNGRYAEKPGALEGKMREINRLISSTFTNYSLEFTFRNYFRDMVYANINIGVKESDPAYRRRFRRNWAHNNMRSMIKMLKAYRAGEYEGRTDLNEDEAAFVEFMENGGQTGYTLINSVESRKKDLERAIERMQNGIDKGGVRDSTVFRYTLGGIELLNEASELVTRFAAFKTSRDMGRSVLKSVNDAKEITVNFNTKGAQDGKGWMGAAARWFGATKFFFNATVQGVQNVKAMADANKLKFGTVVGGLVATGFLMPVLQGMLTGLLGGDDDENWYWDIPEYDRQSAFCVVTGKGKYVKIPLPVGLNKMYALGDVFASWLFDKKHTHTVMDIGKEMANLVAGTVLPVNPLEGTVNELSLMHSTINAVAPSSTQAVIQYLSNTDWKGAPIQKEYTYNRNDPQWEKAYSSNPAVLKALSKWCYENVKWDGWFRGWDWSPEHLDNTLSNFGGGIYSLIKKTGQAMSMIWNEENRDISKVPVVGVLFGTVDERFGYINEAYYDLKEEFDSEVNPIKKTAKAFGYSLDEVFKPVAEGGKRAGDHHPKMQKDVYGNRHFDHMQAWYLGQKKLESINNDIEKQEKKMAKIANPPQGEIDKMTKLQTEYETTRNELVNGMLESKYEQIIDKFRK